MSKSGFSSAEEGVVDLFEIDRTYRDRFERARERALFSGPAGINSGSGESFSIGTLSEKSLHRTLKYFLEENPLFHEQKVGDFVPDIYNGKEIIEIQSRNFGAMKKKLSLLKDVADITVVYPLEMDREILWIDPKTYELKEKRNSNRHKTLINLMDELIFIKDRLLSSKLRILVIGLKVQDIRLLDGYGRDKKRRATKYDKIPLELRSIDSFACAEDYRVFLAEGLNQEFTSDEFAELNHTNIVTAGRALSVLSALGCVQRIGKRGRKFLYRETLHGSD